MSAATIRRYCTCGATLRMTVPAVAVNDVLRIAWADHTGPGHEPTDARGAARGRARAERRPAGTESALEHGQTNKRAAEAESEIAGAHIALDLDNNSDRHLNLAERIEARRRHTWRLEQAVKAARHNAARLHEAAREEKT